MRRLLSPPLRVLARLAASCLAARPPAACPPAARNPAVRGRPARDRRGSVAITTAIIGGTLAGFVALAVDIGTWQVNRSAMQGAADQAAMAASYAITAASMAGQSAAAQTAAAQKEARGLAATYGYVDGAAGVSVAVNIPPRSGSHTGIARAIEVVISQPQQVFLGGMIMGSAPTAGARAVAVPGTASTCIMALSPTGFGITDVGLGTVAANCNIYVNSAASALACDVTLVGAVALVGYDVVLGQPPCIGAGLTSVSATDRLRANAAPAPDPYAARVIPAPTAPCMPSPTPLQLLQPTITLNPGTYCQSIFLPALMQVTLNPGVYVFDSADLAFVGLGTLTGNGVSLVFTSSDGSYYGTLRLAALAATINLTPMTTGPTAGIALWLDPGGAGTLPTPSLLLTTVASVLNINGAIYAPAARVDLLGVASSTRCTQIIASSIHFTGAGTYRHNCIGTGVADVVTYRLLE